MSGYVVVQFINWGQGTSVLAVSEKCLVTENGKVPKSNGKKAIKEPYVFCPDWMHYEVRKLCHVSCV